MLDRSDLYLIEQDRKYTDECTHPDYERYPFVGYSEVCGLCGAIVNKNYHVMDEDALIPFLRGQ